MVERNLYKYMSSPEIALDTIAELIAYQAPIREHDKWLRACIELGYIKAGEEE